MPDSMASMVVEAAMLGLAAEHIATADGRFERGVVWVAPSTGTVAAVTGDADEGTAAATAPMAAARLVDLGRRTVAAGFVDLHVHGGAGCQVNGDDPTQVAEAVEGVAAYHLAHGTTTFLATTVSDSPERLAATVAGVARAVTRTRAAASRPGSRRGARIAGCHLEGPFLAAERAGAQDPGAIRPPDLAELRRLLELGEGTIRSVTLAPELPGAERLIAECLDAGAAVSLGHSRAGYDEARRAFDAGATRVTHLFNAMAPLHHREPGLVGAALASPSVTVELVCDLIHVHPSLVGVVARAASGRVALVTDASPAAGLPAGDHLLGRVAVRVCGSRVTLAGDPTTLAGSVLTMDRAVSNLVSAAAFTPADALAAATLVPGHAVLPRGVEPRAGRLEPGAAADLVVLGPDLTVSATMVAGKVAFDPGRLLA